MRRVLAAACLLGLTPFTAFGLGLGDIELESALNQPFFAEIPLESYQEDDLKSLRVGLASGDTFERYGLDYPEWLQGFEFALADDASGKPVVRVTSQRPVAEPFVTLLLDIKWSSGRLLREFTVLLDPPLFEATPVQQALAPAVTQPEQPVADSAAAGAVNRVAPVVSAAPEPAAIAQQPDSMQSEPAQGQVAERPAPAPQPAEPLVAADDAPPVAVRAAPAMTGTYTVRRRETLWGIAQRVRGDSDLTMNQVMLALYRANPDAFLGNINRLKAGAILRVPDEAELSAVSPAEATAAVREQNRALAGGVAAGSAPEVEAEPAQLTLVPPADEARQAAADDLPASSADVGGDASAEAAAVQAEAARLRSRVDELENELTESQRLLQARDAELAAMQRRLAALEAARESGAGDVAVEDDLPGDDRLSADETVAGGPQADQSADASLAAGSAASAAGDTPFADERSAADETAAGQADVAEAPAVDEMAAGNAEGVARTVPPRESQPGFFAALLGNVWFWVSAGVVLLLALFLARRRGRGADESLGADIAANRAQAAADADHAETMRDLTALPTQDDSILVEEASAAAEPDAALDQESALEETTHDETVGTGIDGEAGEADKTAELQLPSEDDTETPLEKTISTGGPIDLDQADPIAEAEFHMAYGLYDQAAELLERSLESEPENRAYRVKLIEVFFVWENREGFLKHARALHDSVSDESDADWNKVLILGKQLCPDDELFAGSDTAAPTADSMDLELPDLGDDSSDAELDFTIGGAGNEVEALDEGSLAGADQGDSDVLDFDLGSELTDEGGDELALNLGDDDLGADTDDSATTMESPTVEADMADAGADTLETPTIESPAVEHAGDDDAANVDFDLSEEFADAGSDDDVLIDDSAATMETPTIESDLSAMNEPTLESPTLESATDGGETTEMPALDADSFDDGDIDLDLELGGADDLDVDLSGLGDDLAETGINESDDTEAIDTESEETTALPVGDAGGGTDVGDDDATLLAESAGLADVGEDDETLVSDAASLEAEIEAELAAQAGDSGVEASSDTVEQPQIDPTEVELGETNEQPAITDPGDVDFDLGMSDEADEDVATAIQEASLPEDATMTEVGTKLDLARAYIDMGDPDGARSILNEVLDEGGDEQQQEARQLLEELGD